MNVVGHDDPLSLVPCSMWFVKNMPCGVQFYVQLSFRYYLGVALRDHCGGGLAFYFSHSTGSISTLALRSIISPISVNNASTSAPSS